MASMTLKTSADGAIASGAAHSVAEYSSKYPEFLLWNAFYRKPNYQAIPGVDLEKWLRYLKNL